MLTTRDALSKVYQATAVKPDREITAYKELSHEADVAEQDIRFARTIAKVTYGGCHAKLDELQALLNPIAAA